MTSKSDKVVVEDAPKASYNGTVKLQLNIDARAHYTGQVTGVKYEWARAGSIVAVDAKDATALLEKRIKAQSCCSGSDNPVFITVD